MGKEIFNRASISYVLVGISLALHTFVYFYYQILIRTLELPSHWHIQFYLLLSGSFIVSVLLSILARWQLGLILIKYTILLILGYPLGDSLGIETVLLISIILEAIYYLTLGTGVVVSIIGSVILFINQKPVMSWGIEIGSADKHELLFFVFITLLFLFISAYLKRVSQRIKEMSYDLSRLDYAVKELSDINLGFQNYALNVEKDSIERERKRISREMHDIIGYTLTNQLMIIQAVLSMNHPLPEKIKDLLLQSQTQTKEGMTQARIALHKLREFSLDNDKGAKLIYKMITSFQQVTGINIDVNFGNTPNSFGDDIDQTVYRLVQEGLTNAFRHGKASEISISISVNKGFILINIWDNGVSATNINEGIGLKGMRERLKALEGVLEITPMEKGFSVRAKIPYREKGVNCETTAG